MISLYMRLLWSKNNTFTLYLIDHSQWSRFKFLSYLNFIPIQVSVPRNKDLHLILNESRLRSSNRLSILLFNSANRFNRMFFPASYLWYFMKIRFRPLSLSCNWKFKCRNLFSHMMLLNNLCIITACLYRHIISGSALPARRWISVWVLKIVAPVAHSFNAFADAYLSFLCRVLASPGMCQIFAP